MGRSGVGEYRRMWGVLGSLYERWAALGINDRVCAQESCEGWIVRKGGKIGVGLVRGKTDS